MRLPRLYDSSTIPSTFNRLADEVERSFQPFEAGTATIALGTTSTTVASRFVRPGMTVLVTPADAAAAGAQNWYVAATDINQGEFVIRHGNEAADRLVGYFVT